MRLFIIAITALLVVPIIALAQEARIKLPTDYRSQFTNYLSLDRV